MIILRKLKKLELYDNLIGIKNGINKTFTVSKSFNSKDILIYLNGQVLFKDDDFDVTGPNEITFIYVAPTEIDNIYATYEV